MIGNSGKHQLTTQASQKGDTGNTNLKSAASKKETKKTYAGMGVINGPRDATDTSIDNTSIATMLMV